MFVGEVQERFNWLVSKTMRHESGTGVRISPSPPFFKKATKFIVTTQSVNQAISQLANFLILPCVKIQSFLLYICNTKFIFAINKKLQGFTEFIRSQGVIGLAVGLVLGGSVKELVTALINDFINPILGFLLGSTGGLKEAVFTVGTMTFMYGHFLSVLIDFLVISAVVYFVVKGLGLDKIDKKKQ